MTNIKQLLRESINELLSEDRLEFLQNKFKSALSPEVFEQLKQADPTKPHFKYLQWIVDKYLKLKTDAEKKRFLKEDFRKVTEDLRLYDKFKHKIKTVAFRDINKLLSFEDLYFITKPFAEEENKAKEDANIGKATKLLNNADYTVLIPADEQAACKYGQGTRWCTASGAFADYSDKGPLFIIIHHKLKDKEGREVKYQFHFETNQFMDAEDRQIDFNIYIKNNPQVADAIANFVLNGNREYSYSLTEKVKILIKLKKADLLDSQMLSNAINSKDSNIGVDYLYELYQQKKVTLDQLNKAKNDNTIEFTPEGVFAIYNDWSDPKLPELFSNGNRNNYENVAKQILGGEAYEWFIDNIYNNVSDFSRELNENSFIIIRNKILEKGILTKEQLSKISNDELLDLLDEDENFEDIKDALIHAADSADARAIEGAYWEGYTQLIIDELGAFKIDGEKIKFLVNFPYWIGEIRQTSDYEEGEFGYRNFTDWISYTLDEFGNKITPSDEYYDSMDEETLYDEIENKLSDI